MAKEKADSDKPGWFARWREWRAWNKRRQGDVGRRAYDARTKGDDLRKHGGGGYGGGGPVGGF
jgi:hypothetical protein